MHTTIFSMESFRTIEAASHCYFPEGIVHIRRTASFHDFIYFLEGDWEIYLDGVRYHPGKDDVIILPSRTEYYGINPCAEGTKDYFLHMSDHPTDRHASGIPCSNREIELSTVINCQGTPQVRTLFEEIVTTQVLKKPYYEYKLASLLPLFLIALHEADTQNQKSVEYSAHIEEVIRLIHVSPHIHFETPVLAERCHLCTKTFIKYFRAYTGQTPRKYQLTYKLTCVKEQLAVYPDTKLHELAMNFGFYDEFYMSRMFKNQFGISPSEYRLLVQEGKTLLSSASRRESS